MTTTEVYEVDVRETDELPNIESPISGISWGAIVGGAVGAIAVSAVLAVLGSAIGLASVSPWSNTGASVTAIGMGAAIWLIVMQWFASAFGGYLTGRLRTKWAAMGTDEVFFRDTAHGFLAWALATVFVIAFTASVAGGGAASVAMVASGAAQGGVQAAADPNAYFVDALFRRAPATEEAAGIRPTTTDTAAGSTTSGFGASGTTSPSPMAASASSEATAADREASGRILTRSIGSDMAGDDRTYLAEMVARDTGLSQADAEARVDRVMASAKENAEAAREAATTFSFMTALSLAIGAFIAAAAGALGGRHRDEI